MSAPDRTVKSLWLLVAGFGLAACQTPFLVFSGRALVGPERVVETFAFADGYGLMQLEVRPEQPYSVYLRVNVLGGKLYVDAAQRRRWHTYLKADPRVRVKLGDAVYRARAVPVHDPEIIGQFLRGRTIYRLDPRQWTVPVGAHRRATSAVAALQ